MAEETLVTIPSVITVISIIALIITFLLGQLGAETRENRRFLIDVYQQYITWLYRSLAPAIGSLLLLLTARAGIYPRLFNHGAVLSFSVAILIVSGSIFLISRELVVEYPRAAGAEEPEDPDLPSRD